MTDVAAASIGAWQLSSARWRMENAQQGGPKMSGRITIAAGPRLRGAMVLAIAVDVLQMAVFPLFAAGVSSPADDIVDACTCAAMAWLLGWHWEFLPSFLAKLVPGVDLVPLWTLAVANVYRKSRHVAVTAEQNR
jgi:hypothetical protein